MSLSDQLQHLWFPQLGVRGAYVRLQESLHDMPGHANGDANVRPLLGSAVAAAALLQGNLKSDTRLRLQLQGDQVLRLLFAECNAEGELRGLLRLADGHAQVPPLAELDSNTVLAITLDPASGGSRYQALVPLLGDRLDEALGHYFEQSEQLPTRLLLAADQHGATGLMLQRMPGSGGSSELLDEDGWPRLGVLLDTLQDEELLQTEPALLWHRLFHEEQLEVRAGRRLRFGCSCSRERVIEMFRVLGLDESMAALQDDGRAEVDCEFCGRQYHFDRVDLESLFHGPQPPGSTQQH
ncbi:MAG: Hsp33 family molecular chaperone HslO [Xanthomonadales bacterium]|nr:Hsp33 family molecular chaperone HslO [Xanthomonadales bacterium]MCB1634006.1 Hsp33 family molecular chaperone HslO [Xanthomonadales bacterium]MCB1642054.1 Hsp33 family molecular chaperone HslO [Xanthomonadales bacterium]